MTRQFDQLVPIDIPKARAEILKAMSEYQRLAHVAHIVARFLAEIPPGKKLNATIASKLHARFVNSPDLRVHSVVYTHKKGMPPIAKANFRLKIGMYDMELVTAAPGGTDFMVPINEDGTLDIEWAMQGHKSWGKCAAHLGENISRFPYYAKKFNEHLEGLRQAADILCKPEGEPGPVFPLSKHFHYYQLTTP
jgi:hypothetical protein